MPTWVKHAVPELTPEMEAKLKSSLAQRKILLERRLGPTRAIRVDLLPSPNPDVPVRHFWVHWFGSKRDAWPPEDDDHIFSKTETEAKRLMSWLFPTGEEAAEFVQKTWKLHCHIPTDVRTTEN